MSRLGIALALALAATAASAGESHAAGPDSAERLADARHADGGAIVAAPTSGRPSRK